MPTLYDESSDVELLHEALRLSGRPTLADFAEYELPHDERALRRWSEGRAALPRAVRHWLERYVAARRPRMTPAGARRARQVRRGAS